MSRICLCLTGKTLARNLEFLDKYRKYTDLAELRVDCLDPDERFSIRRFPEMAGVPVILTIRRGIDGGRFSGGEGARVTLLSQGLAFADADRRRNFAYVDLEEDLNVPSLEEAARTFGTRIIRSCHNFEGTCSDIPAKLSELRRVGDEIAKLALMPRTSAELPGVYQAARETCGMDKILLCMGRLGTNTRILASLLGSYLSYAGIKDEADAECGAPGQLDPQELEELYRFHRIGEGTRIFGISGYPLSVTASPAFFNPLFTQNNIDAVYVPFPSDSLLSFLRLAEEIKLEGASVTIPYKEEIVPLLVSKSRQVDHIGACNTILRTPSGWTGYNTDARGFSDSLLRFLDRKNLFGRRLTILGAGGAARAVAAEVHRLKGQALIVNRTVFRARDLARQYGFVWGGLDNQGIAMMERYSHVIINTTSAGMEPDVDADPGALYNFTGREAVMDLIYKPERTRFLIRAAQAGCQIINGYDMLIQQAKYQYNLFMGHDLDSEIIAKLGL
ncbi:MAG: type I 3-dehydroquinate dehydratase [Spirochaetaceae bacterium]|jgi:3-dehydroquinate dehydratase/shikimate dehydrogenase|nr:type I 3-dehydroquinate dehydratase [Spirochaetaceae bacterium]